MQTRMQTGSTYYADPGDYMNHLRTTGYNIPVDDLRQRLDVAGDTPLVWWESPEKNVFK